MSTVSLAIGNLERKLFCATRVGCHNAHSNGITKSFTRQKSTSAPDSTGSTSSGSKSRTSKLTDNKSRPKPSYPPHPETRPIRLRGRIKGLINVTPDEAYIPIDTSLPQLVFPDGTPLRRPNTIRPPYLTERLAAHLSIHINDPYIITRSIELFGSPDSSKWVANLPIKDYTRHILVGRTSDFLSALPWDHDLVQPLKDEAWAEHLVAMQSPRLRNGPDDWEAQEGKEQTVNPLWPSDTPSLQNLSLSWSSSAERDTPNVRHPPSRTYPIGKQYYPRPKRIDRFYAWDRHLVVVFASPAARRAVMAAYAWWVRQKLLDAYKEEDRPEKPGVLPPVGIRELTLIEAPVGRKEHEALQWAREVGWRPEYRIRPYWGRRKKNDDGGGWYETEIETRKRAREKRLELQERERLEEDESWGTRGKHAEDGDLDSGGSDSDNQR